MTLLGLVLGMAVSAHAAGSGTTAAEFLKIGPDARGLGMGGAASAVTEDVFSVYWNPAGLAWAPQHQAGASYSALFQDEHQGFVAYTAPLSSNMGRFAVAADYLWISNIEKRASDTTSPDSTFNAQNYALSLTYATAFGDNHAVGVTLKHIRETFDTFSSNSAALDVGVRYGGPADRWTFGASVANIGFNMNDDPLPMLLKGGVAWRPAGDLTLALDLDDWVNNSRTFVDAGGEYRFGKFLALRAGYQLGRSEDKLGGATGLSAGLGVRYNSFNIDYAFLPYGDLGNTHRISLGYAF